MLTAVSFNRHDIEARWDGLSPRTMTRTRMTPRTTRRRKRKRKRRRMIRQCRSGRRWMGP